jgi:FtsZ-binding cell division protein ZapB
VIRKQHCQMWKLLALGALVLVAGCKTTATDQAPDEAAVTEVILEAPTAPAAASDTVLATRAAEVASLQAENQALSQELERVQAQNRALAMEAARLREEVVSRPILTAGGTGATAPAAVDDLVIGEIPPAPAASVSGGTYVVQAASYSNTSRGKKSAKALCDFFTGAGYSPAVMRESGKYVMVLVGTYGSHEQARQARDEIARLDYHGRKGDFASASVRRN